MRYTEATDIGGNQLALRVVHTPGTPITECRVRMPFPLGTINPAVVDVLAALVNRHVKGPMDLVAYRAADGLVLAASTDKKSPDDIAAFIRTALDCVSHAVDSLSELPRLVEAVALGREADLFDVRSLLRHEALRAAYPKLPTRHEMASPSSVLQVTNAQLVGFLAACRKNGPLVTIAGDVSGTFDTELASVSQCTPISCDGPASGRFVVHPNAGIGGAHIAMIGALPDPLDAMFPVVAVLNALVADPFRSRLSYAIRHQYALSYVWDSRLETLQGQLFLVCQPAAARVVELLTLVVNLLSMRSDLVFSAEEMEVACRFVRISWLRRMGTVGGIADMHSELQGRGLPGAWLTDFLGRIGKVDRHDVVAGAPWLDPAKLSGVVVVADRNAESLDEAIITSIMKG